MNIILLYSFLFMVAAIVYYAVATVIVRGAWLFQEIEYEEEGHR